MTNGTELSSASHTGSSLSRLSAWIRGPEGLPAQVAHRLTQPRRRRKVVAPEWQYCASRDELLTSRWPSILWLHAPATLPANDELLFPELATREILESHYLTRSNGAGVGLGSLGDAFVSGQSLVGRSWLLYRLEPFTPLYVDDYLSNDLPVGDRKITRKQRVFVPGVTTLVSHWNSGVYGHWLLEGMPKLLLLRQIAHQLPPVRIVLPRSLGSWVSAWVHHILPEATIELYDDRTTYLHCQRLLMPTLLSDSEHHIFHPELANLLAGLERPLSPDVRRKRIYISRVTPSLFRQLSNQTEIEAIAVSAGLEVVKPETLSVSEQIDLFSHAEIVVGEFGSAMHNTLFSPPGTKVLCLNWINGLQSRIAQLKRHRVAYLLPSEGTPVKYVEGAPLKTYHIDPQRFRTLLHKLLSP